MAKRPCSTGNASITPVATAPINMALARLPALHTGVQATQLLPQLSIKSAGRTDNQHHGPPRRPPCEAERRPPPACSVGWAGGHAPSPRALRDHYHCPHMHSTRSAGCKRTCKRLLGWRGEACRLGVEDCCLLARAGKGHAAGLAVDLPPAAGGAASPHRTHVPYSGVPQQVQSPCAGALRPNLPRTPQLHCLMYHPSGFHSVQNVDLCATASNRPACH
jgi:hypothetical protein